MTVSGHLHKILMKLCSLGVAFRNQEERALICLHIVCTQMNSIMLLFSIAYKHMKYFRFFDSIIFFKS